MALSRCKICIDCSRFYENLNGETVSIEKNEKGELVCGGSRLLGREVETDGGLVIPVMGMVESIQWD